MKQNRFEIIEGYLKTYSKNSTLLEIGIGEGMLYQRNHSIILQYTGVDVDVRSATNAFRKLEILSARVELYEMTSDAFWKMCSPDKRWDFIFVDGCHDIDVAAVDMQQAKQHIISGGFIFVHDLGVYRIAPKAPMRKKFLEIFGFDSTFDVVINDEDEEAVAMGVASKKRE